MILLATIKNTSTRMAPMSVSGGTNVVAKIYQVHVLDERERPIPRKPYPPKGRIWVGSIEVGGLNPGQSRGDRLNISYIYDLSRPGKYKVWVAKPYYRGPNLPNGLVKSNTVTVTVVK